MADVSASRIVGGNSAYGRSQSDFYPPPPAVLRGNCPGVGCCTECRKKFWLGEVEE
jgi:hypothetical protein